MASIGFVDSFYSKLAVVYHYLEVFGLATLGFLLSFTVGHPQLLVGVLVNALIIRAALSLPRHRGLPVVFTPVFGAIFRGVIFGPWTIVLVYLAPFIWAGNYVVYRAFREGMGRYFAVLLLSSLTKAGLIYSGAYILHAIGLVPGFMLYSMGVIQFVTALIGGIIAWSSLRVWRG